MASPFRRYATDGFIGHSEYVRLAGIMFAGDAGDNEVARADDVAAFQCVDPAVHVHRVAAVLTGALAADTRMAVVADNLTFPAVGLALIASPGSQLAAFQCILGLGVVFRVVAILKPQRCIDDD